MCNKILSAEELRKTSFIPNKIELFFIKRKYNKIQKKIFEKIKDAAAEGKTQITVDIPDNKTEKNLYQEVLEHFEFLGYEVWQSTLSFYYIAWESKEERVKNKFNEIKEKESSKKILYPISFAILVLVFVLVSYVY